MCRRELAFVSAGWFERTPSQCHSRLRDRDRLATLDPSNDEFLESFRRIPVLFDPPIPLKEDDLDGIAPTSDANAPPQVINDNTDTIACRCTCILAMA